MSSRVWIGLFLVIFGAGFLMQQANMLNFSEVLSTWWPLVFIIIGIIQFVSRSNTSIISGLLFILIGALFLLNQWMDFNVWAYLWPLILIFVGVSFIFSRSRQGKYPNNEQHIHSFAMFSGAQIKSHSNDFKGGTVSTMFGGAEIDLRKAIISEEGATLDFTVLFGGISIVVSEDVKVEISGIPIFGGWDNKTTVPDLNGYESVLKINCHTFCGGVEVKN